jgi:hypothetical protein
MRITLALFFVKWLPVLPNDLVASLLALLLYGANGVSTVRHGRV